MRVVFAILLVANLALAAAGWLVRDWRGPSEGDGAAPVDADQIRIVRGEPEPAAPVSGAPDDTRADAVCLEFGPLSQEELARARTALVSGVADERVTVTSVMATANWWVYIPPRRSREQADREVARLKAIGVTEHYVVQDSTEMRFAVSLGIFRTQEAAERFAAGLRERGVRNATVGPRPHQIRLSMLVVRTPTDAETARIVEVKADFPGADVRPGPCAAPAVP